MSYDHNYNNDVMSSGYYLRHLEMMADRALSSVPEDQDIRYLEVGCGEGDFLKLVCERSRGRVATAVGFDPSFSGSATLPGGAVIHRKMFTADQVEALPRKFNVICSRHTIEHIPDGRSFLGSLAAMMTAKGTLLIETPDADWILRNTAVQDFFYEHCSIHTPCSIMTLLQQHGLLGVVERVYGDQYLWVTAHAASSAGNKAATSGSRKVDHDLGPNYVEKRDEMLRHWTSHMQRQAKKGPVALWGAASKGVTFSLLINNGNEALINCAIDLNEAKQGSFMPVTGVEILSPSQAKERGVRSIVVMNPNYEDEIRLQCRSMSWDVEIAALNSNWSSVPA